MADWEVDPSTHFPEAHPYGKHNFETSLDVSRVSFVRVWRYVSIFSKNYDFI